jgi:hypothetical protein
MLYMWGNFNPLVPHVVPASIIRSACLCFLLIFLLSYEPEPLLRILHLSIHTMHYLCVCLDQRSTQVFLPACVITLQAPLINLGLESCASPANNWQPVPYNAPSCLDLRQDCRARAVAEQCETQPDMLTQCQASCGLCHLVSSRPDCFDRDSSCYVAANLRGLCNSEPARMGLQGLGCLMSCGRCPAVQRSPSPSPSQR